MIGDHLDKDGADDGGRTMLRLLLLVPFYRGWATPAGPRGAWAPAGPRRSPRRFTREDWGGFSDTFLRCGSCNMFQHFAIGSFLLAKTWPISAIATSNKFCPMCFATGRMYLRTTGMAILPIRIANALKPPAQAPICRAGPQNVAFCWAVEWICLFIWES